MSLKGVQIIIKVEETIRNDSDVCRGKQRSCMYHFCKHKLGFVEFIPSASRT